MEHGQPAGPSASNDEPIADSPAPSPLAADEFIVHEVRVRLPPRFGAGGCEIRWY